MTKIIAEFCQNHLGDRKILSDMIWACAEAGAHYAKIQSMQSSELTFREKFEEGIIEDGIVKAIKRPYKPEFERLKKLDLSEEDHIFFIEECKKAGIEPLTTVFTRAEIRFLKKMDFKEIKVASYDCGSFKMIEELKEIFEHLIISTGATYDWEIEKTAEILKDHKFTFLHCITIYPTPLDKLNLKRMDFLRKFTPSVGFSDHTLTERDGLKASIVAIFRGADFIERHFTILDKDKTKDGPVSINPKQLKELVEFTKISEEDLKKYIDKNIPEAKGMLGEEKRDLSHEELLMRDYYRGRFASKIKDKVIYNWEEIPLE